MVRIQTVIVRTGKAFAGPLSAIAGGVFATAVPLRAIATRRSSINRLVYTMVKGRSAITGAPVSVALFVDAIG